MSLIDDQASLGYWIRRRRKALDLTQAKLAQQVGCAVATIKKIEADERRPSLPMAERLADCLVIPAEERAAFLRVARAELSLRRLATPLPLDVPGAGAAGLIQVKPRLVNERQPARPPNLPQRLTSFIGREQEVVALQALVKRQRLVTLTGVGGVGKSSLALAVADTLTFPDGVWVLELASITESGLVARLLADLFRLPEFPGRTPLETVITYLQHKALLLLVDNCEHLIATCAELVARLLRASPTLHIVATSREALNVAGEREWSVLPLATPRVTTERSGWTLTQLQPFAAARLFIERAQAVNADLVFTDLDAPLIAHLCQQVDGIPLALELAAARCKSLALPELVARLHDRFALLSAGHRSALLRHQTLRATLDWSYDLLSPAEAALFRRLSVFAGGWTMAAAEAVAGYDQRHPPTFDLLHQLVNKSLVVAEQRDATTRYRLLETIRQYASEKLQAYGEREAVGARHFAWYLALAEKALQLNLLGTRFEQWCNEVEADLDNLRAALAWSQTQGDGSETCLRLASALGPFWQLQENVSEGSAWLESALARADPANAELYSWGVIWLAFTRLHTTLRSFDLATEALQRCTALNQPDGIATANLLLGIWATARGESDKAIDCLQHALVWFEANQTLSFLDTTYYYLANAFVLAGKIEQALHYHRLNLQLGEAVDDDIIITSVLEGIALIDPAQAIALFQKQLGQQRQRQDHKSVAALLHSLGIVFTVTGDLPGALAALTESLALWQNLGILWSSTGGTARACLDLSLVYYLRQEYQQAMLSARQAVQRYQAADDLHGVAFAQMALGYSALAVHDLTLAFSGLHSCLQFAATRDLDCTYLAVVGLAEIARRQEKLLLAARLFGIAERFVQRLNPVDDRWKEAYCRPLLTVAHTHLRTAASAAAWAAGQAMPLEQALQVALTLQSHRNLGERKGGQAKLGT